MLTKEIIWSTRGKMLAKQEEDRLLRREMVNDPDWKNVWLSTKVGKTMEEWISEHMICPQCKVLSLRMYASPIMPVIDLVCIHPTHDTTKWSRFFQVKSSNRFMHVGSTCNFLNAYFSNREDCKFIHVGSRTLGELSHGVTPSDSLTKKQITINYICISYLIMNDDIHIQLQRSFIVMPRLDLTDTELQHNWYYQYSNSYNVNNRNVITFNPHTVTIEYMDSHFRKPTNPRETIRAVISNQYSKKVTHLMENPLTSQ
jgi:hypothetical protein